MAKTKGKGGKRALSDEEVLDVYIKQSSKDFQCFARGLIIPSSSGPQRYEVCIADFQRDTFRDLAKSLEAIKEGMLPPIRRFWIERTKKAGKDSDLAIAIVWMMIFAERPIKCQICAANSLQARIIEDRAIELVFYNPWMKQHVEIVQREIRSRKRPREVWARIESSGAPGATHGQTPDILILNELVHVDPVGGWGVMQAHMDDAAGVPQGIVIISTNAGIKGTPADGWRKIAFREGSRWCVHKFSKVAPWLSEQDVEEAKAQDPIGSNFARLWRGEWISGIGGAVSEAVLNQAFCLKGPTPYVEKGWNYIAALDLGISHDHSGLAVVGINREEQRIKEVHIKAWKPTVPREGGKLEVNLMAVEEECTRVSELYRIGWFGYDPAAGGSFMAQRLRRRGVGMQEVTFNSINLTAMATSFVQTMKDGVFQCYEDKEGILRRDFGKFNIEHRPPSNYKLIALSDNYGHADVGTAVVICLPTAVDMMKGHQRWNEEDELMVTDQTGLTPEEVEEMDDGLRDIYEMDQGPSRRRGFSGDDDDEVVGY